MSDTTKATASATTTKATETTTPIMTTETVITAIMDSLGSESYTAYRIHTIINAAFRILEIDRKIEPQRMYQSAKLGQIDGVKHAKVTDVVFQSDKVKAFAISFIEGSLKSGGTSSRIEIASLVAAAQAKLTK